MLEKITGPLMKVAVPLAKIVLAKLVAIASAFAIDGTIQKKKKMLGWRVVREEKRIDLVISNEDIRRWARTILRVISSKKC